jgi:nucleotide-binding universal stress UspA family protein
MTSLLRAMLVVDEHGQPDELSERVEKLFGPRCEVLTMETDDASMDLDLAWGTDAIEVRAPATPSSPPADIDEILPEDGETWRAVVEAARRHGAHVIVVAHRRRSWIRRLLQGSAAADVIEHSDLPVVVMPVAD